MRTHNLVLFNDVLYVEFYGFESFDNMMANSVHKYTAIIIYEL